MIGQSCFVLVCTALSLQWFFSGTSGVTSTSFSGSLLYQCFDWPVFQVSGIGLQWTNVSVGHESGRCEVDELTDFEHPVWQVAPIVSWCSSWLQSSGFYRTYLKQSAQQTSSTKWLPTLICTCKFCTWKNIIEKWQLERTRRGQMCFQENIHFLYLQTTACLPLSKVGMKILFKRTIA